MACEPIFFADGSRGWLCTSPAPVECVVCGKDADRLCDGLDAEDEDGVCSAGLCPRHGRRTGEIDLCPTHAPPMFGGAD